MGFAWFSLLLAGLFEIGWPIGLKLAQTPGRLILGVSLAVFCMAASGLFLYLAQRTIPMGTAYAVWTGIGAAGAFAVGILAYGDATSLPRLAGVGLIVAGVATLKLAS
ncbi:MAG: multidrug efflux SMR transporter [Solidesulfovibrio sp.]|uniref:DMT family transporter n=1 Tax=Solidesulfovibrio sp. TaxID=2910990 RepID=UPI002B1F4FC5|nr:multidrug efflux SMR transporter [Solidesulfovibrio sp.]MEA4857456.1 multidrug efflux SMR transporter [Solidesulfovibrio sp.]